MSKTALDHAKLSTGLSGGWKTECPVSKEDMVVFQEAMKNIMGVDYKPFAVAKQVINGMNYMFIATAHPVIPNPPEGIAKIHIMSSPAGSAPKLINIDMIVPW